MNKYIQRPLEWAIPIAFVYSLLILGNMANHSDNYRFALNESRKSHYGPNLRKEWVDYALSERVISKSLRILSPFCRSVKEMPLQVRIEGDVPGINIQIDSPKKGEGI